MRWLFLNTLFQRLASKNEMKQKTPVLFCFVFRFQPSSVCSATVHLSVTREVSIVLTGKAAVSDAFPGRTSSVS